VERGNKVSLDQEIAGARKEIVADGYDMSVGEIMNLYKDEEMLINPSFQRLFRWSESQKTRFIESLLLGIPIPPIFVVQGEKGVWELIDGLQRLSTVLEFAGLLRGENGAMVPASSLGGTAFLPSLAGKRWEPSAEGADDGIGKEQQLQIKRARLRVEILKKESDPKAKYELFQRLNSGGANLTPQEVRNSVAVMLNPSFFDWLVLRANDANFKLSTAQTEVALEQQAGVELALRFFVFRNVPYTSGLDVHEYLDQGLEAMALNKIFPRQAEEEVFTKTFQWLSEALGDHAFKKWNAQQNQFMGKFLMSGFEVIAVGVAANVEALDGMPATARNAHLLARTQALWSDAAFNAHSGAGVRGTTRLTNLLPIGQAFFAP
jgi:hypothetical protein